VTQEDYDLGRLDKFSVINYIRKYELFGLEGPDCILYFSSKTKKQILPFETANIVQAIKPDIIIWNHEMSPIVIEIISKQEYNNHDNLTQKEKSLYYRINHIRSIVIDKDELKLTNTSWQDFLDSELNRLHII